MLQKQILIAEQLVEKDRQIYVEFAKAFADADMRVLFGGDSDGFDLSQFVQKVRLGDTQSADAMLNKLARPNDMGWQKLFEDPSTAKEAKKLLKKIEGKNK